MTAYDFDEKARYACHCHKPGVPNNCIVLACEPVSRPDPHFCPFDGKDCGEMVAFTVAIESILDAAKKA